MEELRDSEISIDSAIYTGFYPRSYEQGLNPTQSFM